MLCFFPRINLASMLSSFSEQSEGSKGKYNNQVFGLQTALKISLFSDKYV